LYRLGAVRNGSQPPCFAPAAHDRLLDIGLSPPSDGIVDVNDLTVLAGYIGQDVNDATLLVPWAFDETARTTAADSAGNNNLTVLGNATWQPSGGKRGEIMPLGTRTRPCGRPPRAGGGRGRRPLLFPPWATLEERAGVRRRRSGISYGL